MCVCMRRSYRSDEAQDAIISQNKIGGPERMPQVVLMPPDMSSRTSLGERQKIVDAFMRFDTDSSGSLEHEEVLNILTRATGKQMSIDEAKTFLKRFDTNKDGRLNVVEVRPSASGESSWISQRMTTVYAAAAV